MPQAGYQSWIIDSLWLSTGGSYGISLFNSLWLSVARPIKSLFFIDKIYRSYGAIDTLGSIAIINPALAIAKSYQRQSQSAPPSPGGRCMALTSVLVSKIFNFFENFAIYPQIFLKFFEKSAKLV